jgi:hypothetical protein
MESPLMQEYLGLQNQLHPLRDVRSVRSTGYCVSKVTARLIWCQYHSQGASFPQKPEPAACNPTCTGTREFTAIKTLAFI